MKQEKIIYAFRMDESGRLICTPIDNYEVKENLRGEKSYRFRLNGFIKHKTERQLDKFLNNYFYTFNQDKQRARTMIMKDLDAKIESLETDLESAKSLLSRIVNAGFEDGLYDE